jgi:hypothetical protein
MNVGGAASVMSRENTGELDNSVSVAELDTAKGRVIKVGLVS